MASYKEQLQDPRWQRCRLEVMSRDNWQCRKCHRSNRTLNVHHKKYIKGLQAWEYDYNELETLCYVCHQKEHPETEQKIAIASEEQRVVWNLVYKETPPVIQSIDSQIKQLTSELINDHTEDEMEEIMRNVMFLQNKKKELLTN